METYQISLIVAFALALCELMFGAFIMLGFGLGAMFVAIVQWSLGGLSVNRDLLVFAASSVVAIVVFRRLFKRSDDQQESLLDVNKY